MTSGRIGKEACTVEKGCRYYAGFMPDYCESTDDLEDGNCATILLYNGITQDLNRAVEGTWGTALDADTEETYFSASGTGKYLAYSGTMGDNNFFMTFVLKFSNIIKSGAAIEFRNTNSDADVSTGTFCFSGESSGSLVKSGQIFSGGTLVSTDLDTYGIEDDEEVYVEIRRYGTSFLEVYLNGIRAYRNYSFSKKIGQVALHPKGQVMKAYAWTLKYL